MSCTVKTSAFAADPNIWNVDSGHQLEACDQLIESPWSSGNLQRFVGIDATDEDDGLLYNHLHDCEAECYGKGEMYSDLATGRLKYAAPTETGIGQQPPGICEIDQPVPCEWEYPDRVSLNFAAVQDCSGGSEPEVACVLDHLHSNIFAFNVINPLPSPACTYFQLFDTDCGVRIIRLSVVIQWVSDPLNIFLFTIRASTPGIGGDQGQLFFYEAEFPSCPPPTLLEGIFPNQMVPCQPHFPNSFWGTGGVVLTTWV